MPDALPAEPHTESASLARPASIRRFFRNACGVDVWPAEPRPATTQAVVAAVPRWAPKPHLLCLGLGVRTLNVLYAGWSQHCGSADGPAGKSAFARRLAADLAAHVRADRPGASDAGLDDPEAMWVRDLEFFCRVNHPLAVLGFACGSGQVLLMLVPSAI